MDSKKQEIITKLTNECLITLQNEIFFTKSGWWVFSQEKRRWALKSNITNIVYSVIKKSGILDEILDKPRVIPKIDLSELDTKTLLKLKEKNKQNTINVDEIVLNSLESIVSTLKTKFSSNSFEEKLDSTPVVGFRDTYNVFDFETKKLRIAEASDFVFMDCNASHYCDTCHAEGRKKLDYEFRRIIPRIALKPILNFIGQAMNPLNKNMFLIIVNPPCLLWKLIQESLGELCAFSERFNKNGKKRLILHTVCDEEILIRTIGESKEYESNVLIKYTDTTIDYDSLELNETLEDIGLNLRDCVTECHPVDETKNKDKSKEKGVIEEYKPPTNIAFYIDAFLGMCLKIAYPT